MSRLNEKSNKPIPPEGVFTAKWIPYGYKYDPDSMSMLAIDADVSEAVQYIFNEYIDGRVLGDILKDLEEMEYPTPARRKQQLGLKMDGKDDEALDVWKTTSFKQIFCNPIYAGDWLIDGRFWDCVYYYAEEEYPEGSEAPTIEQGHHDALISREDMKAACKQYLLLRQERNEKDTEDNARKQKRQTVTPVPLPEDTSFAALLHCGECGKKMMENNIQLGPAFSFIAYTCSSFTLSANSKCTNRFYKQDEILPLLTSTLLEERKQAVNALAGIGTEENRGARYTKMEASMQKQIDAAVDGVRKNLLAFNKLRAKNQNGKLSDEELQEASDRMEVENRSYEKQLMSTLLDLRAFRSSCTEENPWVTTYSEVPEEFDPLSDTALLHQLVERINLYPDQAPEIVLKYQDEKEALISTLNISLRSRGRNSQ